MKTTKLFLVFVLGFALIAGVAMPHGYASALTTSEKLNLVDRLNALSSYQLQSVINSLNGGAAPSDSKSLQLAIELSMLSQSELSEVIALVGSTGGSNSNTYSGTATLSASLTSNYYSQTIDANSQKEIGTISTYAYGSALNINRIVLKFDKDISSDLNNVALFVDGTQVATKNAYSVSEYTTNDWRLSFDSLSIPVSKNGSKTIKVMAQAKDGVSYSYGKTFQFQIPSSGIRASEAYNYSNYVYGGPTSWVSFYTASSYGGGNTYPTYGNFSVDKKYGWGTNTLGANSEEEVICYTITAPSQSLTVKRVDFIFNADYSSQINNLALMDKTNNTILDSGTFGERTYVSYNQYQYRFSGFSLYIPANQSKDVCLKVRTGSIYSDKSVTYYIPFQGVLATDSYGQTRYASATDNNYLTLSSGYNTGDNGSDYYTSGEAKVSVISSTIKSTYGSNGYYADGYMTVGVTAGRYAITVPRNDGTAKGFVVSLLSDTGSQASSYSTYQWLGPTQTADYYDTYIGAYQTKYFTINFKIYPSYNGNYYAKLSGLYYTENYAPRYTSVYGKTDSVYLTTSGSGTYPPPSGNNDASISAYFHSATADGSVYTDANGYSCTSNCSNNCLPGNYNLKVSVSAVGGDAYFCADSRCSSPSFVTEVASQYGSTLQSFKTTIDSSNAEQVNVYEYQLNGNGYNYGNYGTPYKFYVVRQGTNRTFNVKVTRVQVGTYESGYYLARIKGINWYTSNFGAAKQYVGNFSTFKTDTVLLNSCGSSSSGYCGDGQCNNGESYYSCYQDCGYDTGYGYCGDGQCNNGENYYTCYRDCSGSNNNYGYCGDGICNNNETYYTCQRDCYSGTNGTVNVSLYYTPTEVTVKTNDYDRQVACHKITADSSNLTVQKIAYKFNGDIYPDFSSFAIYDGSSRLASASASSRQSDYYGGYSLTFENLNIYVPRYSSKIVCLGATPYQSYGANTNKTYSVSLVQNGVRASTDYNQTVFGTDSATRNFYLSQGYQSSPVSMSLSYSDYNRDQNINSYKTYDVTLGNVEFKSNQSSYITGIKGKLVATLPINDYYRSVNDVASTVSLWDSYTRLATAYVNEDGTFNFTGVYANIYGSSYPKTLTIKADINANTYGQAYNGDKLYFVIDSQDVVADRGIETSRVISKTITLRGSYSGGYSGYGYCGDNQCNNGETYYSCYQDCANNNYGYCGDGICNNNETYYSCYSDCRYNNGSGYCGDGICNNNETYYSCYSDCYNSGSNGYYNFTVTMDSTPSITVDRDITGKETGKATFTLKLSAPMYQTIWVPADSIEGNALNNSNGSSPVTYKTVTCSGTRDTSNSSLYILQPNQSMTCTVNFEIRPQSSGNHYAYLTAVKYRTSLTGSDTNYITADMQNNYKTSQIYLNAIVGGGTNYGTPTIVPASLTYNAGSNTLYMSANITNIGYSAVTEYGFSLYKQAQGYTARQLIAEIATVNYPQLITAIKRSPEANTVYCIRAYAKNSYGEYVSQSYDDKCITTGSYSGGTGTGNGGGTGNTGNGYECYRGVKIYTNSTRPYTFGVGSSDKSTRAEFVDLNSARGYIDTIISSAPSLIDVTQCN